MSGSDSGRGLPRVFFIISTLPIRRAGGADDASGSRAFGKTRQQEFIRRRMADDNFALLLFRMDLIVENQSEWVSEAASCLLEGYLVFFVVGTGFILVPLKLQPHGSPPKNTSTRHLPPHHSK